MPVLSSLRSPRVRLPRAALLCSGCLLLLLALSGCQTIGYYSQAISGQYEILVSEMPIRNLVADPATPPKLKLKLEQALKLLEFASHDLHLPAEGNYRKYVDLHRPYVVWNVNVAPALSLRPKTWWFPVVGSASYRGYFKEEAAQNYGRLWEKKGWDVYIDGVQAYSTLGWFHDPLLNTYIYESEASLADLIFHELAHQRLYVAGDTDFNEAFAMTVAGAGVRRWFEASHDTNSYQSLPAQSRAREGFCGSHHGGARAIGGGLCESQPYRSGQAATQDGTRPGITPELRQAERPLGQPSPRL